jgi:hypothetical protein
MMEIESEKNRPTDEQLNKMAVDYQKTAKQLGEKYKVGVYAGKTGHLSAADIQRDKLLGSLYFGGSGLTNIGLVRVLFAVEQLKDSVLGPLDVRPPRLYENIGPLKDAQESIQGYSGKDMMLVRIIKAEKAAEPSSLDEKINKQTVRLNGQDTVNADGNSVRQDVVEDLRRLEAMAKTQERVNLFVKSVSKDGWDAAIKKFNGLYSDANSSKQTITLQNRTGLTRISADSLGMLSIRYQGDPLAREMFGRARTESMLMEDFYALMPADSNTLAGPAVVEFKPTMVSYCIKSMVIHRLYQEQFDKLKAAEILRNDFEDSQVLAAVRYNPENILKRMNFNLIQEQQVAPGPNQPGEANAPASPAGEK